MGVNIKDLLAAMGQEKKSDVEIEKEELDYYKKLEKQAGEVVLVWDNPAFGEKRLNKELFKLYELITRHKDKK